MTQQELLEQRFDTGRQLTQLRKENGLTQAQLAALCGVQTSTIVRVETGKFAATLDVLSKICQAFNVKVGFTKI